MELTGRNSVIPSTAPRMNAWGRLRAGLAGAGGAGAVPAWKEGSSSAAPGEDAPTDGAAEASAEAVWTASARKSANAMGLSRFVTIVRRIPCGGKACQAADRCGRTRRLPVSAAGVLPGAPRGIDRVEAQAVDSTGPSVFSKSAAIGSGFLGLCPDSPRVKGEVGRWARA